MRILFIHTFYFPEIVGGAEYSVKKLAEELAREGHEVFVICSGSENKRETINGVSIIRVCTFMRKLTASGSKLSKMNHYFLELSDPFEKRDIYRILDEIKPEVAHTNGLLYISTSVWKYLKKRHIKIVHTLRDYNLCCYKANLVCSNCNIPKVACKPYRVKRKYDSHLVDVVTAPSTYTLNTLVHFGFFKETPKYCVPNAIDFDYQEVVQKCNYHAYKDRKTFRILYLGTLIEKKGVKWLGEAFKSTDNQNFELAFAGKGELVDWINIISKEDKRIKYLGFLDEEIMSQEVYNSDVVIAPSLWDEPFGRIVLDAYKQGVPVIACRSGGLTDLVDDEKTGILIEPGNTKELLNAIIRMYNSSELYTSFCNNIPTKLNNYSINIQAESFLRIYQC